MSKGVPPFSDATVRAAFNAFPGAVRPHLLALRRLIWVCAAEMPRIGVVRETLKWGQPAYLTPETRAGSTLRLGCPRAGGYGMFVHCQTSLIEDFQPLAPPGMRFDGRRGVLFDDNQPPDLDALRPLVRAALSYHKPGLSRARPLRVGQGSSAQDRLRFRS